MKISIISLFPEYFTSPLNTSMLKRALDNKVFEIEMIDLRGFGKGIHKIVDDRPFGGGPGMVLKVGPLVDAIESIKTDDSYVIYLSPQGEKLTAKKCESFAKMKKHLILISGHYEGIDQRVIDLLVDEEVSIGDYILTSGMIPALALVDATVRFLDGGLGNKESAKSDSFQGKGLKGPQYTRPAVYREKSVPDVLLSGDHEKISSWRKEQGKKITLKRENTKTRMASCIS